MEMPGCWRGDRKESLVAWGPDEAGPWWVGICAAAGVCVCARSWCWGSNGVSSPGQTMGSWTAAAATKETLSRGTVYLVSGLTPGPLESSTDADPTLGTRFHPSFV